MEITTGLAGHTSCPVTLVANRYYRGTSGKWQPSLPTDANLPVPIITDKAPATP